MGALDQLNQLRGQGMNDESIVASLQQRGFSPKEINDAFNQSQIKQAVSDEYSGFQGQDQVPQNPQAQGNYPSQGFNQDQGFQNFQGQEEETYYPQPPQQEQYSQGQGFSQEEFYSPGSTDTSTIIEVAEQVVSEKLQSLQRKMDDLSEFKSVMESKVENISERVKRMEKTMDTLQIAILQKVGSYGNNLENIRKEMSMMQDSFKKMVNPLVEKHMEKRTHQMHTESKHAQKTKPKRSSKKLSKR